MSFLVYLAGPEQFYQNSSERVTTLKEVCSKVGLEGISPLDIGGSLGSPEFGVEGTSQMKGYEKYTKTLYWLRSCRAVLANLTPFRGPSAETSTTFVVAYAKALNIPVVGYTSSVTEYKFRAPQDGNLTEDFGMVDNSLLASACEGIFLTPEEAVAKLVSILTKMHNSPSLLV